MSQHAGLAAVTLALRALLDGAFRTAASTDRALADVILTTLPVDRARSVHHRPQVNLTMVTALDHAGARNAPRLGLRGPEASIEPAQQVNLLYMVTAYGPEEDDVMAQRAMGVAMHALHANPVLDRIDLDVLFPHTGQTAPLKQVRVTQASLTREQIVAWWLAFHTPYRLTSAYQVGPVPLG